MLLINNYPYLKNNERKSTENWRCGQRCGANAVVERTSRRLLRITGEHDHKPNAYTVSNGKYFNLKKGL